MRTKIEHRIGVRTPAEAVWRVLADIEAWPKWNPLYPKAAGVIRIGAQLDLEVVLPGQAARAIQPTIVDWIPNEQLLWRLRLAGGLVKTTRYFEIEELTPASCIFSNGEMFDGLLGPTIAKRLRRSLREGFRAMGEAVKTRAEEAPAGGEG
ncbi:MAG TPA: SRPBCC domain-containing protein [Caulobacteraceae bacterium]